jgi:Zn-dependent peptidase ImmA (M78 family)
MKDDIILRKQATEFRQTNGFSNSEPIRLTSLLMKLNVLTVFKRLGENISGMSVKVDDENKFMAINSDLTLGRQHFTICHELYHLFIQNDFESMMCNAGEFPIKDKLEYKADIFASHLLLPEEGLIGQIPINELSKNKISLETIIKIEQYFSSSRHALLVRLDKIKLIDFINYEIYLNNVINSAKMLGYDSTLYTKGNVCKIIGDYGERAKRLFENGKISEQHYISLMHDIGIDIENTKLENG